MKHFITTVCLAAALVLTFGYVSELISQQPVRITNLPADSNENVAPATPPVPMGCRYRLFGSLPSLTSGNMGYIDCNTSGVLLVQTAGDNIASGQVSVGSSATLIAAARVGRAVLGISTPGSSIMYCGASGVTITTGQRIEAVAGTVAYQTTAAVYCVLSSGSMTVSYAETY